MEELKNIVYKFALREDLKDKKEFLPTRAEPKATGWDVRAAMEDQKDLVLRSGDYFKIPLGIRTIPHEGWWYQLHPRSSSFVKKKMHNLIGIIDEDYSLELIFAGQFCPQSLEETLIIKFGDAIGQIIPIKRVDMIVSSITNEEYNDLCTKRNSVRVGGFGSTTKDEK